MPFHVHTATSSQKKFLHSFIDFSCLTIGPTEVTVVGEYEICVKFSAILMFS